jgi:hypothetical protein
MQVHKVGGMGCRINIKEPIKEKSKNSPEVLFEYLQIKNKIVSHSSTPPSAGFTIHMDMYYSKYKKSAAVIVHYIKNSEIGKSINL